MLPLRVVPRHLQGVMLYGVGLLPHPFRGLHLGDLHGHVEVEMTCSCWI